ncbi:major facilitator superfamily domain-containing protein [Xylogone sp. PMI_703]|nr:major facilitator superfamily domain-containing protein [Xylogone sp. PMI_703]
MLDATIIATALVTISNKLHDVGRGSWIVLSYLSTYTGFMLVFAHFSNAFGIKLVLIFACLLFVVTSIVAATAASMTVLIAARFFQGIGGAGLFSLVMVWVPRLVSPEEYTLYIGILSTIGSLASVLGPLLGGVIVGHTTWKWIFWINIPAGCIAMLFIYFAIPRGNPASGKLPQIDWLACELLSVGSVCLVLALSSVGMSYTLQWRAILGLSIVAGVHIAGFAVWQAWLAKTKWKSINSLLPLPLLRRRSIVALLCSNFLTGFSLLAVSVYLPQRFQIVNELSPTSAGVRMLPFLLTCPVATIVFGAGMTKWNLAPLYALILGQILLFSGVVPLGFLSTNGHFVTLYICQIVIGFGVGASTIASMLLLKLMIPLESFDVIMGFTTQLRITGGALGVAICSAVLRSEIVRTLTPILTATELFEVFHSTSSLSITDPGAAAHVRETWARAFNLEMKIMAGFGLLSLLMSLLIWEKRARHSEEDIEYQKVTQNSLDSST